MKKAQIVGITLTMKVEGYGYGAIEIIPRENEFALILSKELKFIPERQALINAIDARLENLLKNKEIEL